jgi:general secretion pathway protein F
VAAFEYLAIDQKGQRRKGVLEGDAPRQIRQKLRESGLIPIEVTLIAQINKHKITPKQFFTSISSDELTLITRQLATLLSAGLQVEEALASVLEQAEKSSVKKVLASVHARVVEGSSLAESLASYPKIFPPIYRATVAAGEQTGHLDAVMNRLADYTEQQYFVRQKTQQALIYPIVMLFISFAIVSFLLVYVVPKIVGVFTSTGQELPLATKILLNISYFLQHYGLLLIGLLIVLIIIIQYFLKRPHIRFVYELSLLKIPVLGKLLKIRDTARFAHTLGILNAAGVPILEALQISADVVSRLPIRAKIQQATLHIKEGDSINHALKQSGYFTPMAVQLIASGESTGRLETMLERCAHYQEQEVTRATEVALALFEPFLILVMGGIVLFIVLAILLPIFSISLIVS